MVRRYVERYLPARGWADLVVLADGGRDWPAFLAERGYDVTVTALDGRELAAAERRFSARGLSAGFLELDAALGAVYSTVLCPARTLADARDPCVLAARLARAVRPGGQLLAPALTGAMATARHPCLAPERLGLRPVDGDDGGAPGALRAPDRRGLHRRRKPSQPHAPR